MSHKAGIVFCHSTRMYVHMTDYFGDDSEFTNATCVPTSGSKTITCDEESDIVPGNIITGTGIPADTVVTSVNEVNAVTSFTISNAATSGDGSATVTLTFDSRTMWFLKRSGATNSPYTWTEYVSTGFPPVGFHVTGSYVGVGPWSTTRTQLYMRESVRYLSNFVAPVKCRPTAISWNLSFYGATYLVNAGATPTMRVGLMRPIFAHDAAGKHADSPPIWENIGETSISLGQDPENLCFRGTTYFDAADVGTLNAGDCCGYVAQPINDNVRYIRGTITTEYTPI